MKKTLIAIVLLLICSSLLYAVDQYAHYMVGYVDSATDFTVSMLDEVLPFDLESPEVAFNEVTTSTKNGQTVKSVVKGLRVGIYTLFSNGNYKFTITHTPFNLVGTSKDTDTSHDKTSIDYRFYLILNGDYESCTSNGNIVIQGTSGCSYVNQSIYVSLDEGDENNTQDVLNRLKAGNYSSTVTFCLEGGN